jgi:hypothetical protein
LSSSSVTPPTSVQRERSVSKSRQGYDTLLLEVFS